MKKEMKLLGVIITNNHKWHKNTKHFTKKAWARMQLSRKVASLTSSINHKLDICKQIVRSVLKQFCTVWHSSHTGGNEKDLEKVQKAATRVILGTKYKSYAESLETLGVLSLKKRREGLYLKFAKICILNPKTSNMFKTHTKQHHMNTRKKTKYKITHAKTARLKRSAIPFMEELLNKEHEDKQVTGSKTTT